MNNDVFLSLLALDSYNRGYGQNVLLNAGDSTSGQDEAGRQIGNATILNVDLPSGSVAAGFYAIAYDWNGQTIISYRGTDEPSPFLPASDIWTRLSLGAASSPPIKPQTAPQHNYCAAA